MAARRAKDEVLNYLRVLEHINAYQNVGQISEEHLLALHHDITQNTLDDPATEGTFRKVRVFQKQRAEFLIFSDFFSDTGKTGYFFLIQPAPEKKI